ncbi:fungal specific transcription factor [Purpureocillium lavendulum]|uniref:Fungal specific transcription factor n=1 Tax=Purpureocillium lavendulum TaxID=1247861 RepID=A0AB34FJD2_9HYPO|nr:fungal specific transcription factor [Purpureocillium lavendulum]
MSSPVQEPGPMHGGTTRPYRSQKRQRPCDRCRERKLRCQTEGGQPPCQRCQQNSIACTFLGKPRKRAPAPSQRSLASLARSPSMCESQHRSSSSSSPLVGHPHHDFHVPAARLHHPQHHHHRSHGASVISSSADEGAPAPESRDGDPSNGVHAQHATHLHDSGTLTHALGTPVLTGLHPHRPSTQLSQSLDQIEGHAAVLLGGSSESDPWLLRHCRFDELGLRTFHKLHFRHAGGVPTSDKIPVHFLLSADELCESAAAETRVAGAKELRAELDMLVPPAYGVRLIRLHVFPILPVVSRTQLGLTHIDAVPDRATLETLPVHLLAALYGSALPFAVNDDQLAVLHIYDQLPLDRVWRIVYRSLQDQLHRPRLSVLQAALLYLHKTGSDRRRYAASDTAFVWSFMGTVVGLAHSLGLHLECRMFGVPAWEKRLRRRLWWAVYIEDKWLSLLTGRPPYIRQEEWDVNALDDADFDIHHPLTYASAVPAKSVSAFRDMARLALVADSVQVTLYSLRSCQRLSEDLPASIQAAKPLFDALNAWRATIPVPEPFRSDKLANLNDADSYPASVYFAYLTLVVYVWRALLRPTVRSLPPPQIIDVDQPLQEAQGPLQDTGFLFEDFSWDFSELPEIELHLEEDVTDTSATVKELHQAAQTWAGNLVNFTWHMSSSDFGEFWYSWSRISFAVVSNFLMVLLVQAPSSENALKAKQMLENWRRVLRDQSKAFPLLLLAMTRLNGFYWAGLSETFLLPQHVQEVLQ